MKRVYLNQAVECPKCHAHVVEWMEENGKTILDFHYVDYPNVCSGKFVQNKTAELGE